MMDKGKNIVNELKKGTEKYFHPIGSITPQDIEDIVFSHIVSTIDEYGIIDVVVEYQGDISEDALFDVLNESCLEIVGISVDINPITEYKTGTLEIYLPCVEEYLQNKSFQKLEADIKVTKKQ